MARFRITQIVECETEEQANEVAAERLGYDEDYGFEYRFGWQAVKKEEEDIVFLAVKKDALQNFRDAVAAIAAAEQDGTDDEVEDAREAYDDALESFIGALEL